jgi:ribosome-associated protein
MEFQIKPGEEFITLQSLLKAAGLTGSGGEAKAVIVAGEVRVDGEVETRRGKKIRAGQTVSFAGQEISVTAQS